MRVVARHKLVMQLRRLMAEASRFPELGRLFYERAPRADRRWAGCRIREPLADRGALRLEDPQLAAERFNWSSQSGESGDALRRH